MNALSGRMQVYVKFVKPPSVSVSVVADASASTKKPSLSLISFVKLA